MDVGASLSNAIAMATVNPARLLGVNQDHGLLKTGDLANLIL